MRLADFCNPHFKDEHPNSAWLPTPKTPENRRIHVTRFTSLDRPSTTVWLLTTTETEDAVALAFWSPTQLVQAPTWWVKADSTTSP
jgi:hypothetical protein